VIDGLHSRVDGKFRVHIKEHWHVDLFAWPQLLLLQISGTPNSSPHSWPQFKTSKRQRDSSTTFQLQSVSLLPFQAAMHLHSEGHTHRCQNKDPTHGCQIGSNCRVLHAKRDKPYHIGFSDANRHRLPNRYSEPASGQRRMSLKQDTHGPIWHEKQDIWTLFGNH
jgi:hypothetical protein